MSSSGQDSEAAATPHNGINSNSHKEDLAADEADHVPDGDLFGDGSQDGCNVLQVPSEYCIADKVVAKKEAAHIVAN